MLNKPRAGEGAKAEVLTKMIYPRRNGLDEKEKSIVILIEEKTIKINKKQQQCYTFNVDGFDKDQVCYAITRYVHVFEEGSVENLFDPVLPVPEPSKQVKEKKEKWRKSKAKKILYDLIMNGTVPMQDDPNMPLELIYDMDPEFQATDIDKFKGRLQRLRAHIQDLDSRAGADLEAFRIYKKNHKPSLVSHKGYIQWQGYSAQELLWDDLDMYLKKKMKPYDLWKKRKEYRDEFPLDAFADKIKQEIRTKKYIRTRDARARGEKT
jgi:hypothetical protein